MVLRFSHLFSTICLTFLSSCGAVSKASRDFVKQHEAYETSNTQAFSSAYVGVRSAKPSENSGDVFSTFESEDGSVDASRKRRPYSNGRSKYKTQTMAKSEAGIKIAELAADIISNEKNQSIHKEGNEKSAHELFPDLHTMEEERSLSGGISFAFQIKMFWEKGMRWQNRKIRKQYCIECAKNCEGSQCDSATCRDGRNIMITKCDADDTDQWWFYDGFKVRPKRDTSLCWTRKSKYVVLDKCRNSMNKEQAFTKFKEHDKFQIRPRHHVDRSRKEADCLTNQHHPKSDEPLYMDDCKTAEENDSGKYDDTSRWVIGIGFDGHSGGSNWDSSDGGYYPDEGEGSRPERNRYRNNY